MTGPHGARQSRAEHPAAPPRDAGDPAGARPEPEHEADPGGGLWIGPVIVLAALAWIGLGRVLF